MRDKTAAAVAVFSKLAIQYQERFMDTQMYHDTFDLFCESVGVSDARILEVACGPGNITQYLLQQRPDYQITATDLSDEMLELARNNVPGATFVKLDMRAISQLSGGYDGIVCGFGLPYLSQEEAALWIADAVQLLAPSGILYMSTMEDAYEKSGWERATSGDEVYMHYHEGEYLTRQLLHNGMEVLETHRKSYTATNGKAITDLILISRKQQASKGHTVSE